MRKRRTCHFCADVGFETDLHCGEMEAGSAIEAVGVEQCHGGHLEMGTYCGIFLGHRSAFEEAEGRAGVKFDVQVLSSRFSVKTNFY